MNLLRLACLTIALICAGCSKDPEPSNNGDNNGNEDASTPDDMASGDVAPEPDAAEPDTSAPAEDTGTDFCATADCMEGYTCSDTLQKCVQCLSDNDCVDGNLRACDEAVGPNGEEPTYECVECTDDTVCAGGTCDQTTHTCGV